MASITTIQSTDIIANSRTDINNNFANLNNDKIETSYLDTDTSLAANSDTKIATQKAVKAYVDAGGNVNASETSKGIVEEATDAEVTAGTATGATGARLFINPNKVSETGINKIIKTKSTGLLDVSIVPGLDKKVGVGELSNPSFENYQFQYGNATGGVWGWTSIGTPTYSYSHVMLGSAQGVERPYPINTSTTNAFFNSTKRRIFEWNALIQADTTTGTSAMGFGAGTGSSVANYQDGANTENIAFITNSSGAWYIHTSRSSSNYTSTLITTPTPGVHSFRIDYQPATTTVDFYIDGILVGTINTSANMPSSNNQTITMLFSNGTTSTIIACLSPINVSIEK